MSKTARFALLAFLALFVLPACSRTITFSRHKATSFTRLVSIPDEAVIYMQNLALMRDNITIPPTTKHLELVLPPRLIVESLQLRSGARSIQSFNIKRKRYTLIRIRNLQRYVQPGKPLSVEYLTWGLHWSAQYRINLVAKNRLAVQMGALIQNNWYNLNAMRVTLVAGWIGGSLQNNAYSAHTPPQTRTLTRHASHPRPDGIGPPSPMFAALKPFLPQMTPTSHTIDLSRPTRRRLPPKDLLPSPAKHRTIARSYKHKTRAFNFEYIRKYRIKRIDKTATHRRSNFQRQFSRYYKSTTNHTSRTHGYSLYKGLNVSIPLREKSLVQVANVQLPTKTFYLWPADLGESVFMVYKLTNKSKVLLPGGTSWMYRDGVFIGQDFFLWTPIDSRVHLTSSNDGQIAVKKRISSHPNNTSRTILSLQNASNSTIEVEVFEKNPLARREGTLRFNIPPLTKGQTNPLHRWRVSLAPKQTRKIQIDFRPTPPPPSYPASPHAAKQPRTLDLSAGRLKSKLRKPSPSRKRKLRKRKAIQRKQRPTRRQRKSIQRQR